MDKLEIFLQMGGYAAFVWPAYGLAAVIMVGFLVASLRRLRHNQQRLGELETGREKKRD